MKSPAVAFLVAQTLAGAGCTTESSSPPPESDVPEVGTSVPILLDAEFAEEFRVEALFGEIESMRFAPHGPSTEGELVVLDRQLLRVFVYDRAGNELHAWGRSGEGLGEFSQFTRGMALSSTGRVAVRSPSRLTQFDLAGEFLESHSFPEGPVADVAYDADDNLVVRTRKEGSDWFDPDARYRWMILRPVDGEVLWTFAPMPSVIQNMTLHTPAPMMADLGQTRSWWESAMPKICLCSTPQPARSWGGWPVTSRRGGRTRPLCAV